MATRKLDSATAQVAKLTQQRDAAIALAAQTIESARPGARRRRPAE